jgi:hypothetical protein
MAKISQRKRRESEFVRLRSVKKADQRRAKALQRQIDHSLIPANYGQAISLAEPVGREWPEMPCGWLDRSQWSPGAI